MQLMLLWGVWKGSLVLFDVTNWNIAEGKFVILMCPREWGTISFYPTTIFCPENVVCVLSLQCTSDKIFRWKQKYEH